MTRMCNRIIFHRFLECSIYRGEVGERLRLSMLIPFSGFTLARESEQVIKFILEFSNSIFRNLSHQ